MVPGQVDSECLEDWTGEEILGGGEGDETTDGVEAENGAEGGLYGGGL